MERRRTLRMEGEKVGREWKVLLDKTVTDNSIYNYVVDVEKCTEFFVSISFAGDPSITTSINGGVRLNSNSGWSGGVPVVGNISTLPYDSTDLSKRKTIAFVFHIGAGYIIPISSFRSFNDAGSKNEMCHNNSTSFRLNVGSDGNVSYQKIEEVKKIAVGSYTKYFGAGTKIFILGR